MAPTSAISNLGQIQWQQKSLNELHQQMEDWGLAFQDPAPKHILVCEITQEEFRRRISSLQSHDDISDPNGKERAAQADLVKQFINARVDVRNKSLFEYHKQKLTDSRVRKFREQMVNEYEDKLLAHLLEPDGVAEPSPLDFAMFVKRYFVERGLEEYLEKGDREAKEIVDLHFASPSRST
ncbi:hypothetical protein HYFRA_00012348 [Hymenoscyphus fraxineus]|uniref:Uncharacterized protein n=1 Tax=Hymenoscyphus fraxineus TaxID=746836 RepID=A0A9N9L2C1_9HELO|nr:hypothetical protein HYFRA_00012348 [Hymenoscyphus fraxineus]